MTSDEFDEDVLPGVDPGILATDLPTVNWEAVQLAARLRGVATTYVAIAEVSGVAESTLRNWVNDRVATPIPRTVDAVANALDVPRQFLLEPRRIPIPSHLTFRRKSNREFVEERAKLAGYASLAGVFADFVLGGGGTRASSPDPLIESERWRNGQVSARHFRSRLGLDLGTPIANMVELAESLGVLVVFGPAMPEGLDACSAIVDERRIIVIKQNGTDCFRERWDIAHELGHLVMGHDSAGRENEAAANEFAEGLLFPWTVANRGRLLRAVRDTSDLDTLFNIEADWGISIDALLTTARKQKLGGAQDKVSQLAEYRRTMPLFPPPLEMPSVLARGARSIELERGRTIVAVAKEEGFPADLVRLLIARTTSEDAAA